MLLTFEVSASKFFWFELFGGKLFGNHELKKTDCL